MKVHWFYVWVRFAAILGMCLGFAIVVAWNEGLTTTVVGFIFLLFTLLTTTYYLMRRFWR